MKKSESRGLQIDNDVKKFINSAINRAGSANKLAGQTKISGMNFTRWLGNAEGKEVECIDWPSWEKLWRYLVKHELIDASDIRWMPPSALRDALASSSASVSGSGNIVAGRDASGNSIALPPGANADDSANAVETFRAGLIMELIGMDVDMAAKDQILRMIKDFRKRQ